MYGIGKIFETKFGGLISSLLCGSAYFIIILDFILKYTQNGGMLLGFFFFPAIICGMALVIFKSIKRMKDEKAFSKINALIYMHIILMAVSVIFLIDIIK